MDSHDPKEQTEPLRMPGNAPDNLLDSPPGLWPKDLLWEGKLGWTCTLTHSATGGKGDRSAIQQRCHLSDLAVIITSFRILSVQNALTEN